MNKLIAIDPGHAGNGIDPGAAGKMITEADLAYRYGVALSHILDSEYGYGVLLTKEARIDKDSDSLGCRVDKANAAKADIFVSIHLNSAPSKEATGTETFYSPDSAAGMSLAANIQKEVARTLKLPDRGCKTADFYVLKKTLMPACLLEAGFINNPKEEILLLNSVQEIAEAIAAGIAGYFKHGGQNNGAH